MASPDNCYSDIGCFPVTKEFYHPQHRPLNVKPWHRRRIKTTFTLYNQANPHGYQLLAWDELNLAHSKFDFGLETKIIVPGWMDGISRTVWVKRAKDALLWLWAPVNIIVMSWTNMTPYIIATANTRIVGAELASFIKFIEHSNYFTNNAYDNFVASNFERLPVGGLKKRALGAQKYSRAFFHVIGHSLGAHIGGYAGTRMPGLGRITALDPARPFFQGMPPSVRLDKHDAKFVDAIHSDFTPENAIFLLMSFGMTSPVGHVDFYPNGPPLLQPGCIRDSLMSTQHGIREGITHSSIVLGVIEAARYLVACDHQRSHEWFVESIVNRKCVFTGVRCSDFWGLVDGRCTCDDSPDACAIMGINADQLYLRSSLLLGGSSERLAVNKLSNRDISDENDADGDGYGDSDGDNDDKYTHDAHGSKNKQHVKAARELKKQKENNELFEFKVSEQALAMDAAELSKSSHAAALGALSSLEVRRPPSAKDLEDLYENENRWYLKTSSKVPYCVNQYQVLVFLGPAGSRLLEREPLPQLSPILILTIVGSRGKLVKQRFVPEASELRSMTLQPFFVMLEGAYELGDIHFVVIAWDYRRHKSSPRHQSQEYDNEFTSRRAAGVEQVFLDASESATTSNINLINNNNNNNNNKTANYLYLPNKHNNTFVIAAVNKKTTTNSLQKTLTKHPTTKKPQTKQTSQTNKLNDRLKQRTKRQVNFGQIHFTEHDNQLTSNLNLDMEMIRVTQVQISPIQVPLGDQSRHKSGNLLRNTRVFCPPRRHFALRRSLSLRLALSLTSSCH